MAIFHPLRRFEQGGFTALDVILVLVIIGIAAAVGVSRSVSRTTFDLATEAETLKTHLRYVQYRSMRDALAPGQTLTWGLRFNAGSYDLLYDNDATSRRLPNEDSPSHTLARGITMTSSLAGSVLHFNEWGNPVGTDAVPLTADVLITLTDGSASQTVRVTQNTGFIP
ncbi:MAG: type II secretion system protein [Deltaproteobacteria bacterium]|nr:type II secretion system protein [Deltaproteobacteria bacterium]